MKAFIPGVPICNPVAGVLIRHPTSSSVWERLVGHKPCPLGPHSLPSGRGHFPYLMPGLASLPGPSPKPKGSPTRGATTSLLAVWSGPQTAPLGAGHHPGPEGLNGIGVRSPLYCTKVEESTPLWDRCWGSRGMPVPHSNVISNLCSCRCLGMKPNGIIMPGCGCGDKMCHGQHHFAGMKCSDQFCCQ